MLGKKYANGTPIRRAVEEGLLDSEKIVQVGIRGALFKANDLDWAKGQGVKIFDMDDIFEMGLSKVKSKIRGLKGIRFAGADINKVCPPLDPSGNTALVACHFMFE